jgi:hypothetical protein
MEPQLIHPSFTQVSTLQFRAIESLAYLASFTQHPRYGEKSHGSSSQRLPSLACVQVALRPAASPFRRQRHRSNVI